jgi:hypothetical protein
MSSNVQPTGWVGWGRFAAIVLVVSGIFSVVQGIVALAAPDTYFVVTQKGLAIFNVNGWGWWTMIVGILLVLIGGALFTGATWARVLAVVIAIVSAVGQLFLIPAQPWWALIIIAVDVLVIYAVTVHGRELKS